MVNVCLPSYLVHQNYKLNYSFPFTDKRAKTDKHNVGQKQQQEAKKGSDADCDVLSEGDGFLDSQGEDLISESFSSLYGEIF